MAQVGVRTRARALAMAAAAASESSRKRKVENEEIVPYLELRNGKNRRRGVINPENSVSPAVDSGERSFVEDRCSSLGSSDFASGSCCSSNGSIDLRKRSDKFADLEDESVEFETSSLHCSCRERRETTPSSQLRADSSGELDSKAPASIPRRRSTAAIMPTQSELEEFFTEAENNIQKRFAEKYNYDVAKDKPLEGRYQWEPLKSQSKLKNKEEKQRFLA